MQDELAKIEKRLRDDHEEKVQQGLLFGRPDLPPPGKIEVLVWDGGWSLHDYQMEER
jgi:hypothetical protein